MDFIYNEEVIDHAVRDSQTLEYRFSFVSNADAGFLMDVLRRVLFLKGLSDSFDELNYILMEWITNANKANIKRIYFKSRGLDISNPSDYESGISGFSTAIQSGYDSFIKGFEELGLQTRVLFEMTTEVLRFSVINSACATAQEERRVRAVIANAGRIRNTIEAFERMADKLEGANLGTLTSILMMRRLGLTLDDYQFMPDRGRNETAVRVTVPVNIVTLRQADRVADVILSALESLPGFPENISRLQRLIADENVDFAKVAAIIQSDPALTADLLRLVNSAQYMLPKKVSSITNALSLIGIRGIKNLLYSFGTQQLFEKNLGRFDSLWEHAFRTASYAYNLARETRFKALCDDAYLGGVLHDMGKILVYHVRPGLLPAIREHCGGRIDSGSLLETLALGATHARIGGDIAAKWNFPDFLISVIQFHHAPLLAKDADREITALVYLANMICHLVDKEICVESLDGNVLEMLGIGHESMPALMNKLDGLYKEQKNKMDQ